MNEAHYLSLCGWRGVDAIQQGFATQFPTLTQAAPQLLRIARGNDPVLLYKAYVDVLGAFPDYPAQTIGDCTSFGHGHGNDVLQCVEIGLGAPMVYQETDTEFLYGEGRKVAGILGRQDGGYGAAVVKAMTTVGMVSRKMLGSEGAYSGQRAKEWGLTGPPADAEAEAAPFKLGAAAQVSTYDELVAAISNGNPVTTCFSTGFTMTRDAQGFCRAQGRWGHCEVFVGVRFDRPGACLLQSWGPDQPAGPTALGQPDWSFWVDQATVERMLAEGDSWALSKSPAFERRDLPPAWSYHDLA